jgi:hypothetical protein
VDRWRVQATWTAGGERRSYAPVFHDSEAEALREREGMEDTLAHFPTLEVTVEEVTAEAAALEGAAAEPEPLPDDHVVHLMPAIGADVTACGLGKGEVRAVAVAEIFDLADARCPACAAAARE